MYAYIKGAFPRAHAWEKRHVKCQNKTVHNQERSIKGKGEKESKRERIGELISQRGPFHVGEESILIALIIFMD